MAIQPIDLQALFTQLDKVGKEQVSQKQGLQLQQAIQGAQIQRKTEERIQSVNESQDTGNGLERVKDRSAKKHREYDEEEGNPSETGEDTEKDPSIIRDPALGRNVDLSG
jgi:low affinity Fe/Cu permease